MNTVDRISKLERCVPYQLRGYRLLLEWLVFKGCGVPLGAAGIFVALPLTKEALIRCFARGGSGIMMFRHMKKENLGLRAFTYKGRYLVQRCITFLATAPWTLKVAWQLGG